MSGNVIPIKPLEDNSFSVNSPCVITLYYPPFVDDSGTTQTHNAAIVVEDGDWQGMLDAIRDQGGAYNAEPRNGKLWIFPWPPSAISLHAIDRTTREPINMTG